MEITGVLWPGTVFPDVAPHLNVKAGVLDPKIDGEDWFGVKSPSLKGLDVEPKRDVVVVV